MPSHQQNRSFAAPLEEVRDAAHDALLALGAEVTESEDGTVLSGRTGWTLFSFGEVVRVTLAPGDGAVGVTVESSQRVRVALMDLGGRNRKNVGSVLSSMASRLPR